MEEKYTKEGKYKYPLIARKHIVFLQDIIQSFEGEMMNKQLFVNTLADEIGKVNENFLHKDFVSYCMSKPDKRKTKINMNDI